MKRALLGVVVVAVCCLAAGVTSAASATCVSDYAFRGDMAHWVYAAGFQATVDNARALEKDGIFDLLHQQFAAQKTRPLPVLSVPCTQSLAFRDAVTRAAVTRRSLGRVAALIAGFPLKRAALPTEWRPVLAAATTGAAAALRLARDIGTPSVKVAQLTAQLAALRRQTSGTT